MSYSVIFMGTPEFAKVALESIINAGHNVISVYTQPPKPVGRKHVLQKSSVHNFAESLNIPVNTPTSMRSEEVISQIQELNPDVIIVAAYGFIIPEAILNTPKYGCINIHASILPRWRGAAPIQHAIMYGDKETGISIMKMDKGMDTGDIISIENIEISANTTYGTLIEDLSHLGGKMIVETLSDLENKLNSAYKQPVDGVTIAPKITKDMEQINWSKTAVEIERNIRAFSPSPLMWSTIAGIRTKIVSVKEVFDIQANDYEIGTIINDQFVVKCGQNTYLQILQIQPAGKNIMPAQSFINGHKEIIGAKYEENY